MQMTPLPFWLTMVSRAMAVLPVHHAAHAAVEKQHLAVGRAGKSVHAGDAVAHGQNRANLLGKHIRRPREHRFLQKRDHIALRGSKLFQRALFLAKSWERDPVV